jgi:hypothetical protein
MVRVSDTIVLNETDETDSDFNHQMLIRRTPPTNPTPAQVPTRRVLERERTQHCKAQRAR